MDTTQNDRPGQDSSPGVSPNQDLEKQVVDALRTCYDPEIPVNIYELGLIYNVDIQPGGAVNIRMTLTSPMCPVAESLPPEVETKIRSIPDVSSAKVEVVWDPPWTPAMMSEAAKLQLNMM
ncbi:MAG: SUF system Fe-S cluster assembly protein [Acidobacteria bacterium]|nr:MAG: SUF system Fe-S cluster assembly protein [Acidobacteriota bacterium]